VDATSAIPTERRVRLRRDAVLRHRPDLGREAREVAFLRGEELEALRDWGGHALCRAADGRLFTVPSDWLEPVVDGAGG